MSSRRHDRRRFRRRRADLPVREVEPNDRVYRATVVSGNGIFCPYAGPRNVGEQVVLEIDLMTSDVPIRVLARVVSTGLGPSRLGVGFAFDSAVPSLERFVERAPGFLSVSSAG